MGAPRDVSGFVGGADPADERILPDFSPTQNLLGAMAASTASG